MPVTADLAQPELMAWQTVAAAVAVARTLSLRAARAVLEL
jgi:hypothetical protein